MGSDHISKPKAVALAAIAGWIAVQFIPIDRSNPPVATDLAAPPDVTAVLRRACYDCHSNETRWPWYGYLAPTSWLLSRGVAEGRKAVNFSTWPEGDPAASARLIQACAESVSEGRMPPRHHAALASAARLSDADRALLKAWAEAVATE